MKRPPARREQEAKNTLVGMDGGPLARRFLVPAVGGGVDAAGVVGAGEAAGGRKDAAAGRDGILYAGARLPGLSREVEAPVAAAADRHGAAVAVAFGELRRRAAAEDAQLVALVERTGELHVTAIFGGDDVKVRGASHGILKLRRIVRHSDENDVAAVSGIDDPAAHVRRGGAVELPLKLATGDVHGAVSDRHARRIVIDAVVRVDGTVDYFNADEAPSASGYGDGRGRAGIAADDRRIGVVVCLDYETAGTGVVRRARHALVVGAGMDENRNAEPAERIVARGPRNAAVHGLERLGRGTAAVDDGVAVAVVVDVQGQVRFERNLHVERLEHGLELVRRHVGKVDEELAVGVDADAAALLHHGQHHGAHDGRVHRGEVDGELPVGSDGKAAAALADGGGDLVQLRGGGAGRVDGQLAVRGDYGLAVRERGRQLLELRGGHAADSVRQRGGGQVGAVVRALGDDVAGVARHHVDGAGERGGVGGVAVEPVDDAVHVHLQLPAGGGLDEVVSRRIGYAGARGVGEPVGARGDEVAALGGNDRGGRQAVHLLSRAERAVLVRGVVVDDRFDCHGWPPI